MTDLRTGTLITDLQALAEKVTKNCPCDCTAHGMPCPKQEAEDDMERDRR